MGNSKFIKVTAGLLIFLAACSSETPIHYYPLKFGHEYPVDDEFQIALKYGVEPQLLKAIVTVESNGDHTAINPKTLDYGIGQINLKTAEAYNMDIQRLITDREYSLRMAAKVLSWFQKTYAHREPDTWVCRYNVGTAKTFSDRQQYHCDIYLHKVRIAYNPKDI